jgi:hypothetical protein
MAETDEAKFDLHILKHLLQPSYLSATIAVATTLVAIGTVVLARLYLSTGWLADSLRTIASSDQHLFSQGANDGGSPFNTVLLFLFWAGIGLVVYFIVIGFVQMISEIRELEQEMNYVHTNRRSALLNYLERLVARCIGLGLLFITAAIYLKLLLPFVLSALSVAEFTLSDLLASCFAILFLLIVTHLLAVLLRVVALRPRLFTAEIES